MTLKSLGPITVLLLGFCAAANAGKVDMTSDYGEMFTITPCTLCIGATDGATITGEDFIDSNGNLVFDFAVTNLPGSYTVDLTATDATITDNYGLFTCPTPGSIIGAAPQCSNDLPNGVTTSSDYGSLNGADTIASLPVTGAASGDEFVFFAELDGASGAITASIEPNAVPEPRLLPLLGFGLFATFVLFRRRRIAH